MDINYVHYWIKCRIKLCIQINCFCHFYFFNSPLHYFLVKNWIKQTWKNERIDCTMRLFGNFLFSLVIIVGLMYNSHNLGLPVLGFVYQGQQDSSRIDFKTLFSQQFQCLFEHTTFILHLWSANFKLHRRPCNFCTEFSTW